MVLHYRLLALALVICSTSSSRVVPPKAIRKIDKHTKQEERHHEKLLRIILQLADSGDLPNRNYSRSPNGPITHLASPQGNPDSDPAEVTPLDVSEATDPAEVEPEAEVLEWTSSSGNCRGSNGKHGGYCQNLNYGGTAQDCVEQADPWIEAVEYAANTCTLLQAEQGAPESCPAGFSGPHSGTGSADDYTGNGDHGLTCYVATEATTGSALAEVKAVDPNDDPREGRDCDNINTDLQAILVAQHFTAAALQEGFAQETHLKAECQARTCVLVEEQGGLPQCMKEKSSRVASLKAEARLLKTDPDMANQERHIT